LPWGEHGFAVSTHKFSSMLTPTTEAGAVAQRLIELALLSWKLEAA